MSVFGEYDDLDKRLSLIENRIGNLGYDLKSIVTSEFKSRWTVIPQTQAMFSMITAVCVTTVDPWKEGSVQFYSPLILDPNTPVKDLPWAWPVSSMGGFDDCGMTWVPPAGSMLCILFENGHRSAPFYIGTVWSRTRGKKGRNTFGYPMPEYDRISQGHRGGYLLPPDDESQVFMPWNTETYNGNDIDMIGQFEDNPEAKRRITSPHHYGFKTPEKGMLKICDGDPKCDRRWKRFELMSGTGNWIIMKDDHLHPSGQWAHPECGCGSGEGDAADCTPSKNPNRCYKPGKDNKCGNPYFKHKSECRPYKGPQTPQNNKADLEQSGIQLLTVAGHTIVMDDSVEQPRGRPTWERSTKPFDFGCNNKFTGKFYAKSVTGHSITMNDKESDTNIREDGNGVILKSATGNLVLLNDHTVKGQASGESKRAGENRGITLQSTSQHQIKLCDKGNVQSSPDRKEGGKPVNNATNAYMMIRTGYGLEIRLNDNQSQQETQPDPNKPGQEIIITSPQYNNKKRGYHRFSMHEVKEGPGTVFLRAGGNYIVNVYDSMQTVVGMDGNEGTQSTFVSGGILTVAKSQYHVSQSTYAVNAADQIFLLAGKDCDRTVYNPDGTVKEVVPKDAPCAYQVVINRNPCYCPIVTWMGHFTPGLSTSERVFASGYSAEDTRGAGPCEGYGGSLGQSQSNTNQPNQTPAPILTPPGGN